MSPEKSKHSIALVKSEKAMKKHAAKKSLDKKHYDDHHPAKHHPKKHDKHGPKEKDGGKGGKDLRRAYEHLARVRVLLSHNGAEPKLRAAAERLAALVTDDLRREHAAPKLAAELARAAEHMAFAALVVHDVKALPWSARIESAVEDEYGSLRDEAELPKKAKDSGARMEAVRTLHALMMDAAEAAGAAKNYTKAMECVRAAESLASALEHGQ